jgi:UDP-2,3-diacylglucosamine hydrolase
VAVRSMAEAPAVPECRPVEYRADPQWRTIDLVSDLHLTPTMPRTFERWREYLMGTAGDAVLMLGDLFEVWVGDDARLAGFEARCLQVLQEAAAIRSLAFMPGNRDFLVGDALLHDAGVARLTDPTLLVALGQRLLLTHGDALCLDDHDYQRVREEVRSASWQQRFLALPLAERQRQARLMRDASTMHQAGLAPQQIAEVDAKAARLWLAAAAADIMVHGHTHRPGRHRLAGGGTRHVLGDWDLDGPVPRARALRLTRAGLTELDLAAGGWS